MRHLLQRYDCTLQLGDLSSKKLLGYYEVGNECASYTMIQLC
jgi:hypothetical protein